MKRWMSLITIVMSLAPDGTFAAGEQQPFDWSVPAVNIPQADGYTGWINLVRVTGGLRADAVVGTWKVPGGDGSCSTYRLSDAWLNLWICEKQWISGKLAFQYEEGVDRFGDEPPPPGFGVDEAFVLVSDLLGSRFSLAAGYLLAPFGIYHDRWRFDSSFVSEPITSHLAESHCRAATVHVDAGRFGGAVCAFNGTSDEGKDTDYIDSLVMNAWYLNGSFFGGMSWLSDLAETDLALLGLNDPATADEGANPRGVHFFAALDKPFYFGHVEGVGALTAFSDDVLDLDGDGHGDQPLALNVELGYRPENNIQFVGRYEYANDAPAAPRHRYGLVTRLYYSGTSSVAIEYLHADLNPGREDTYSFQVGLVF
ncbi:hypothetical protein JW905_12270 [bacterium]|nr:hypothetical protein [candidate division CSSED10-310 bacterium]